MLPGFSRVSTASNQAVGQNLVNLLLFVDGELAGTHVDEEEETAAKWSVSFQFHDTE